MQKGTSLSIHSTVSTDGWPHGHACAAAALVRRHHRRRRPPASGRKAARDLAVRSATEKPLRQVGPSAAGMEPHEGLAGRDCQSPGRGCSRGDEAAGRQVSRAGRRSLARAMRGRRAPGGKPATRGTGRSVRPLARVVCHGEQPAAATDCRHQVAQGHLTLSGGRTATAYVMSWRVPAIAVTPSHGNLRAARIFGRNRKAILCAETQPRGRVPRGR